MSFISRIKHSIRWKLICIFMSIFGFFLLSVILANTFLLERYYAREKIDALEEAYETIDSMIREANEKGEGTASLFPEPSQYDPTDASTETEATAFIRNLTETSNISVIILDSTTDRQFTSAVNAMVLLRRLSARIFGNQEGQSQVLEQFDNYFIEYSLDQMGESGYLESWGYFSDNTTIFIMSMPLSSLKEPMVFFNRFLLFVGILSLLLYTIVVYLTTRRFTRPIDSLAKLSKKMAKLDFSARYEGDSQDEIGILGNAINEMSTHLENAIAELKTANNELQLDIENKTKIDERRQEFVANVSHELKTPIALIQGYAEGLMDGLAEDPETRDYYCSVIVDEAKRMNRMVRELMNLSAIEQGKDLPDFSLFSLKNTVEGVLQANQLLIEQKEAHLEVDVPDELMIWADEFKIEEVITNYLNNALNHMTSPNQISIYTERLGEKSVSLHVRNSGNPIPEESISHIWDKFYKVDKAHSRSYGGSGIGLSIVKAIADAHHQSCGVKNTLTGVDFWFTLERKEVK